VNVTHTATHTATRIDIFTEDRDVTGCEALCPGVKFVHVIHTATHTATHAATHAATHVVMRCVVG